MNAFGLTFGVVYFVFSVVHAQSQIDEERQRDRSANWRGGKNQPLSPPDGHHQPRRDEDSISYLDTSSELSLINESSLLPIYAMLTLTVVVFALFVNWFFKLRCGDRVVNRNRRKV